MDSDIKNMIKTLEQQRNSIDRAIAALHELDGSEPAVSAPAPPTESRKVTSAPRGSISDEGRRRLAAAMKARWAIKKKASAGKKRRLRLRA